MIRVSSDDAGERTVLNVRPESVVIRCDKALFKKKRRLF